MKIMQLNAWYFKLEDEIFDFLQQEQPDIVFLEEVADGIMSRGVTDYPLDRLADQLGYEQAHAKSYSAYDDDKNYGSFGVAILTKYPINDRLVHYVPYLGGYREFTTQEVCMDKRGKEDNRRDRLRIRTFEWQAPSPVLDVQVDYKGEKVRLLCTHFKPSQQCTESFQMLKHVQYLDELLGFHTELPTVLGGDFNIGKDAIVLQQLYEHMEHVLDEETNTLNHRLHPGFQHDIPPEGYHVDHILQQGFLTQSATVPDIDVSDHFPIICELRKE